MTANELSTELRLLFTRAGAKTLVAYFVVDKAVRCIRIGEPQDVIELLEAVIMDEEKLIDPTMAEGVH